MVDEFIESALKEEARLARRLAAVRALIADYGGATAGDSSPPTTAATLRARTPRAESMASKVVGFAEEYLKTVHKRARSKEIYEEIRRLGTEIIATNPEAIVASYLSSSDKFDNVRGQGYGLTEWNTHEAPSAEVEEAS
jgi:hypothetical protein